VEHLDVIDRVDVLEQGVFHFYGSHIILGVEVLLSARMFSVPDCKNTKSLGNGKEKEKRFFAKSIIFRSNSFNTKRLSPVIDYFYLSLLSFTVKQVVLVSKVAYFADQSGILAIPKQIVLL
jgi:hypothetical protein